LLRGGSWTDCTWSRSWAAVPWRMALRGKAGSERSAVRAAHGPALPRQQPVQLRDVLRLELVERVHAQQLHRAHHLLGQDLDGAVHARAAAGHEPVEVGATDQGEARAEGHGRSEERRVGRAWTR